MKRVNNGIIAIKWHTSTRELLLKGRLSTVDLLVKKVNDGIIAIKLHTSTKELLLKGMDQYI